MFSGIIQSQGKITSISKSDEFQSIDLEQLELKEFQSLTSTKHKKLSPEQASPRGGLTVS